MDVPDKVEYVIYAWDMKKIHRHTSILFRLRSLYSYNPIFPVVKNETSISKYAVGSVEAPLCLYYYVGPTYG